LQREAPDPDAPEPLRERPPAEPADACHQG
jgi:hypothetical protein